MRIFKQAWKRSHLHALETQLLALLADEAVRLVEYNQLEPEQQKFIDCLF